MMRALGKLFVTVALLATPRAKLRPGGSTRICAPTGFHPTRFRSPKLR